MYPYILLENLGFISNTRYNRNSDTISHFFKKRLNDDYYIIIEFDGLFKSVEFRGYLYNEIAEVTLSLKELKAVATMLEHFGWD